MQRLHLGRASGVDDRIEDLVVDAHRGGRAPCLLRLLGGNDRDRLAEVANAVEREHRLVCELEAVALLSRDVLLGQRRMDSRHGECGRNVDGEDPRVRVWAADGLAPEHPGLVEVARVRELALHLGYGVAPDRRRGGVAPLQGARRRTHEAAARRTASRIFWYPVQRQRFPERASRISSSVGSAVRLSRSAVATTSPGVQKPH